MILYEEKTFVENLALTKNSFVSNRNANYTNYEIVTVLFLFRYNCSKFCLMQIFAIPKTNMWLQDWMNESSTFSFLKVGRNPAETKLVIIETALLVVTVYVTYYGYMYQKLFKLLRLS